MIRRTLHLRLPRGRFSSMLDMGGMPSEHSASRRDMRYGKNNKLQAIALDFDLITRSLEETRKRSEQADAKKMNPAGRKEATANDRANRFTIGQALEGVVPNVGFVQDIADVLNVQLGGELRRRRKDDGEDDISAITGAEAQSSEKSTFGNVSAKHAKQKPSEITSDAKNGHFPTQHPSDGVSTDKAPHTVDVRDKYASKLRAKVEGGIAGIELSKAERTDSLTKGDAAGHLSARAMAVASRVDGVGSKWLATTGTAGLLTFVSSRSMKVALVPLPERKNEGVGRDMESLARQLSDVTIHVLVKQGKDRSAEEILDEVQEALEDVDPIRTLVVSDRDDYLRSARDAGMYTCRVRPKNARRGEITASYNVETIAEVEDVINEINGLSFNTVVGSSS